MCLGPCDQDTVAVGVPEMERPLGSGVASRNRSS